MLAYRPHAVDDDLELVDHMVVREDLALHLDEEALRPIDDLGVNTEEVSMR
jgi:hypothetical protein